MRLGTGFRIAAPERDIHTERPKSLFIENNSLFGQKNSLFCFAGNLVQRAQNHWGRGPQIVEGAPKLKNSLLFSLLAGNLGRRLVRS